VYLHEIFLGQEQFWRWRCSPIFSTNRWWICRGRGPPICRPAQSAPTYHPWQLTSVLWTPYFVLARCREWLYHARVGVARAARLSPSSRRYPSFRERSGPRLLHRRDSAASCSQQLARRSSYGGLTIRATSIELQPKLPARLGWGYEKYEPMGVGVYTGRGQDRVDLAWATEVPHMARSFGSARLPA